ncbi:DNA repair protein RecO [Candidatus Marimicrobium litorale]|uniref:DNA repair protein RecO n=1 Tax=Candidatus Marimicrobium litorale TaxID=2518991 RepID=A0ABT3T2Y4_9GAMM|nr:DNA repair protein RecO [Candidatus Marimicrobium litorale]MCX2976627.1 DNA repair protein RecO [Candidatus Marimicrobium litorale]
MRVNLQPGYVIHSRPYGDSSALLDVFTAEFGRVGLVAKGARRQTRKGSKAGLLQPFIPLLLSFSGGNELKTLRSVESAPGRVELVGDRLFSGLYVNELLVRLLHRDDPHPRLFAAYNDTVQQLAHLQMIDVGLRLFEMRLLEELGYRLELTIEGVTGLPVRPEAFYHYQPGAGLVRRRAGESSDDSPGADSPGADLPGTDLPGTDLLAMARGEIEGHVRQTARTLMREALAAHLGEEPLKSRQLFARGAWKRPGAASGPQDEE